MIDPSKAELAIVFWKANPKRQRSEKEIEVAEGGKHLVYRVSLPVTEAADSGAIMLSPSSC